MIKEYLEKHHHIGRLYSSYLVNIDEPDLALQEIKSFIKDKLLSKGDLDSNPDYMYIQNIEGSKNISVDQIRKLQDFLHKTSVISGKKIALIYDADKMNINAANCCLKILEEPPANTYLFLITENASGILPTIRSRCTKISHHYDISQLNVEERFIKPLLKSTSLTDKLAFVKEFSFKDRNLWIKFASSMEVLLVKFCHKMLNNRVSLSSIEQELLDQFESNSLPYIQAKYEQIKTIIDEVNEFDLDLRTSCILLMDKLHR